MEKCINWLEFVLHARTYTHLFSHSFVRSLVQSHCDKRTYIFFSLFLLSQQLSLLILTQTCIDIRWQSLCERNMRLLVCLCASVFLFVYVFVFVYVRVLVRCAKELLFFPSNLPLALPAHFVWHQEAITRGWRTLLKWLFSFIILLLFACKFKRKI